ncbi:hypothetical protein [Roseofilum casamattae]|uniref:Uncharacterized protein n=1 Tax=Roseofilum casamattae BLCC-M143 TaxID=3022442 RepID=A0ABT7BW94_9CYAN|nr:hypothetical protein [Roseofilum casamattae]MDJ1183464.1 hypothetical protein [Roseofilum casamattae BLCC-M143]
MSVSHSPTHKTTASSNPLSGSKSSQWQMISVRELFSQINWEFDPEPVQRVKQLSSEGKSESVSLTLSVERFFTCINWDGQREIAPSDPQPPEPDFELAGAEDDVTLDDFSSLF